MAWSVRITPRTGSMRGIGFVMFVETNFNRNARGQFTSDMNEIGYTTESVMEQTWDRIIQIHEETHRPRTGRLRSALKNPANRYRVASGTAAQFGQGLMNPEYLDQSVARYWRIIEYGSKVAAPRWIGPLVDRNGIPLYGKWGDSLQPPGDTAYSSRINTQKLHPYKAAKRAKIYKWWQEGGQYGDTRRGRAFRRKQARQEMWGWDPVSPGDWKPPMRLRHVAGKEAFRRAWEDVAGPRSRRLLSAWADQLPGGTKSEAMATARTKITISYQT